MPLFEDDFPRLVHGATVPSANRVRNVPFARVAIQGFVRIKFSGVHRAKAGFGKAAEEAAVQPKTWFIALTLIEKAMRTVMRRASLDANFLHRPGGRKDGRARWRETGDVERRSDEL